MADSKKKKTSLHNPLVRQKRKRRPRPAAVIDGKVRCRNCGGYYDLRLPRCTYCGAETRENPYARNPELAVHDHGGGFERDDKLDRASHGIIIALIAILLVAILGTAIVSGLHKNKDKNAGKAPAASVSSSQMEDASSAASSEEASAPAVPVTPPAPPEPVPGENDEPAASVTLNYEDVTLRRGETLQLKATVLPEDWEGTLIWTSSKENVAFVDENGLVTQCDSGTTHITVSAGGTTAECVVRSHAGPSGLTPQSAGTNNAGTNNNTPANNNNNTPTTPPANNNNGTVNNQGGTANNNNGTDNTTPVEPASNVATSKISLSAYDLTLNKKGDYANIHVIGDYDCTYESSDRSVATVNEKGHIVAKGSGKCKITARSGDFTAVCKVKVK